jgi:penicillin G amidase
MTEAEVLASATLALGIMGPITWAQDAPSAMSTAVRQQRWNVDGLRDSADIIIDHWGIPHIFAASARDAFFLQGYNAARDRLWQIDL